MPLIETKGAASAQGFGLTLGSSGPVTYIEDVFSTWLYTGNDSAQTITNGIDLSGKGGMVWRKRRTTSGADMVMDTLRGTNALQAYSASGQFGSSDSFTALSNGFSFNTANFINVSGNNYASWTFRKQPKFFDVVTWTGTGANPQVIPHNLGSVPGCIIVKATNATDGWGVYHRSLGNDYLVVLNTTAVKSGPTSGPWASTTPTSTQFTVGSYYNGVGTTFVAYLFAHDAGGFGLTGSDNVISCGTFTTDGSANATITLGYEPQWVLIKPTSRADDWKIFDTMRGWISASSNTANYLLPNTTGAEGVSTYGSPNATGFTFTNASNETSIYIAIRRGPMKVPTSGTSVFSPIVISGATGNGTGTTNFPVDLSINSQTTGSTYKAVFDRMRQFRTNNGGTSQFLYTNDTSAETTSTTSYGLSLDSNTSFTSVALWNGSTSAIYWNFRRAPGFFDVVCYAGTGVAGTVNHNLGVAPEMMLVKSRNAPAYWRWYWAPLGATKNFYMPNNEAAVTQTEIWNNTAPTSTVFTVGTSTDTNFTNRSYVAYLFATCPGVSKVGSYTGTGALQTINCGFTGGARFVLIKRTDSTGDWYVYDSARGISSSNDPYLFLNTPDAEVTGTNYVDTTSVGFQVTAAAPAGLNANGGTYIFLAIA